jgi:hypothetical protein
MMADEYHTIANELADLTDAYGKAGFWRRGTLAVKVARYAWAKMPAIYAALIHHTEGMKAQRQ